MKPFTISFSSGAAGLRAVVGRVPGRSLRYDRKQRSRQSFTSFPLLPQGRPDYALASAGGGVVGHSLLAPQGQPRWAPLLQRASRLLPGGMLSYVHPHADQARGIITVHVIINYNYGFGKLSSVLELNIS